MNQSVEEPKDTNASITQVMSTLNTLSSKVRKSFPTMETTESAVSYPVSNDDLRSSDESIEISRIQGKNILNISTYRILFLIYDCIFRWKSLFPILMMYVLGCRSNWDCPKTSHYCKMSRKKGPKSIDDNSKNKISELSDVGTCTSKGK